MSQQPKEVFKNLNLIYLALISGQLLMCGVFVFISMHKAATASSILIYIAPIVSIGTITVAFLLRNNHSAEAQELKDDKEKINHFRSSHIIRWALLEGGNLCMLIFFYLEGHYLYLFLFACGMAAFAYLKPKENTLKEDYNIS